MRFRPCIDIHNGKVKQIVGASLNDDNDAARENYVSEKDAAYYADMYRRLDLPGGHVIMLNPRGSDHYEATRAQALQALRAYPGGLMAGGGIDPVNAADYLDAGASHVIVTSYVFKRGIIDEDALDEMQAAVGRERLCLDLSCRRRNGKLYIVTDRWQVYTEEEFDASLLRRLSDHASEFLVHSVDAEGRCQGIDEDVLEVLKGSPTPVTYAGGISSLDDIRSIREKGRGAVDVTVGSALDIFGGHLSMEGVIKCIS